MEAEGRAPKPEALGALHWRSEIQKLLYRLRGEGPGNLVDPPSATWAVPFAAVTAPTAAVTSPTKKPSRAPVGERETTVDEHAAT
jgi:hypothetical protein